MGLRRCGACCTITLWIIASIVVFVVLAVFYFDPVKTLFFSESPCVIHNTIYVTQYRCSCGLNCQALYPCLLAYVLLNGTDIPESIQGYPIWIFMDDWQYLRSATSLNPDKCYMEVCHPDTGVNRDTVELYRLRNLSDGSLHTCRYDWARPRHGAYLHRAITWQFVVHLILWPSLSLIASFSALAIFVRWCRRLQQEEYTLETPTCSSDIDTLERY